MKCYRWVKENLASCNGSTQWEIGKWQKHKEELVICESGFHACKSPPGLAELGVWYKMVLG